MKKKKNKILAFICTLAIAFCGVLGLNLINNVDNVSANAAETEITDLTGTRWYFNEPLDFSSFSGGVVFSINFKTDGNTSASFVGCKLSIDGSSSSLIYLKESGGQTTVYYSGRWSLSSEYRYIDIFGGDDVTNADLISFMELNAVLVSSDQLEDSSSSSSIPVDPPIVTNLTGTIWNFNEYIDFSLFSEGQGYHLSYILGCSPERVCSMLVFDDLIAIRGSYVDGGLVTVYNDGFWLIGDEQRWIEIIGGDDATNVDLISFMELNAVLVSSDPELEDSSSSSSTPVDPEPEDSSSSSSDLVDPDPEDSSSSSSDLVDPDPDLDPLAPRYGIFANMRMDIIAFDDLGHSVEMESCVCDFFYHGFSINSEMYEEILTVWDAYQYGSSIDFFHVRIAFDMPVSIDSLVSLSYTGISENEIEDGRWFGLATGFNTDTMDNITTLPWKYRSTDDGSKDWYLSVGVNEIVYKNYVGLIIPQISFDDFFKFSVFLPVDSYMNGYNKGFSDGQNEGFSSGQEIGYDEGYEDGSEQGYDNGYKFGYAEGFSKAESQDPYGFITWAYGLLDMPGRIISNALNFEFMGLNLLGFASFVLTVILVVYVVKKLKH